MTLEMKVQFHHRASCGKNLDMSGITIPGEGYRHPPKINGQAYSLWIEKTVLTDFIDDVRAAVHRVPH